MQTIFCRKAPTIGDLEGTPEEVWGTSEYEGDIDDPCVFFGLYGLTDFYAMWRHRAKRWILWAGSDITNYKNGYWLDDKGEIKIDPLPFSEWVNVNCESWVENEVEHEALKEEGIESKICPSFMGEINNFPVSYTASDRPKLYTSVSGNNFELYGWDTIPRIAEQNPDTEFHLYGSTISPWPEEYNNIISHGRVPKEQMNEEIKTMQGALRLTTMDGFSEIIAKSVLMGQYPVSSIKYPYMLSVDEIETLKEKKEPNLMGRNHYMKILNQYPWNVKKH